MYKVISTISALIRQFVLPNPYIVFFQNESIADLFNIFIGGAILHYLSRWITGIYYTSGENYSFGSISYLFWYCANTGIITIACNLIKNIYILITTLVIVYLFIFIIVIKVSNKIKY